MQSIEDIYSNSADKSKAEVATTPEPETHVEPAQDAAPTAAAPVETGDKPAAPQPQDGVTPAPESDLPLDVQGLRAAVKAERQKRQEYETKVSEYDRQLAEQRARADELDRILRSSLAPQPAQRPQPQQQQQPQMMAPDPLTDPEGAFAYQQRHIAETMAGYQNELVQTRIYTSQEMMRSAQPDYDDIEAVFLEESDRRARLGDTSLATELRRHPVPAKFAYEVGKELIKRDPSLEAHFKRSKMMREMGDDPDGYIQRKIAEALSQKQAEAAAVAQQQAPVPVQQVPTVPTQRPLPPQSLASVPSVSSRSRPAPSGPVRLEDLYK